MHINICRQAIMQTFKNSSDLFTPSDWFDVVSHILVLSGRDNNWFWGRLYSRRS